MRDFIAAVLPWIGIGLLIAVYAVIAGQEENADKPEGKSSGLFTGKGK